MLKRQLIIFLFSMLLSFLIYYSLRAQESPGKPLNVWRVQETNIGCAPLIGYTCMDRIKVLKFQRKDEPPLCIATLENLTHVDVTLTTLGPVPCPE